MRICARGEKTITNLSVYSPVAGQTALRIFATICINFKWTKQADISTAFLHGRGKDYIHYKLPQGHELKEGNKLVWKTKCTIYGFENAANCWFNVFN